MKGESIIGEFSMEKEKRTIPSLTTITTNFLGATLAVLMIYFFLGLLISGGDSEPSNNGLLKVLAFVLMILVSICVILVPIVVIRGILGRIFSIGKKEEPINMDNLLVKVPVKRSRFANPTEESRKTE